MSNFSGINVCLIRHGESLANAGHVTSDPTRVPLTEQGWAQARHIAAAFEQAPRLTQAGLQTARARGRTGGRPKALTPDQQSLAVNSLTRNSTQSRRSAGCWRFRNRRCTSIWPPARKRGRGGWGQQADPDFFVLSNTLCEYALNSG